MLATSKNHRYVIVQGKNSKLKPDTVIFYSNAKKGVDLSDQMSSYYSCLRRTTKWYKKFVIELICGTCFVNAWYVHRKWDTKSIKIFKFREEIIYNLLNIVNTQRDAIPSENEVLFKKHSHFLHSYHGPTSKTRRRCKEYYKRISRMKGREYAANQV